MRYILSSIVIFSFIFIPFYFLYHKADEEKTAIQPLTEQWSFRQVGKDTWIPATVPGAVHLDLLTNGIIENPFYRDNETKQMWIERSDWEYKTTFSVESEIFGRQDIDLVFEGLDTYADVYLNDELILSADNMFIAHEVPVKGKLKRYGNELRIYFHSASNVGMHKLERSPYLVPAVNEYADSAHRSSVFTRKAPFHYGWDWGPRIVTCGVWRPVYIRGWATARISSTYHQLLKLFSHKAEYSTEVVIEAEKRDEMDLEVLVNGEKVSSKHIRTKRGKNTFKLNMPIINPHLWWPNGFGEQYLYEVTVNLIHNGDVISKSVKKVGVRTLELVQEPENDGTSFKFRVNGQDIFIKGSNYIPPDNLHGRVTNGGYEKVVKAAVDANMNMLRVWGGAIYENDAFYDLCDEHGLLVWQDMMFACSMSPGDSLHLNNIKKEFEYNIERLRGHPSLALWCGNNENMIAWFGWGLQKRFNLTPADSADIMKTYMKIFYKMLPEAILKLDSTRTYWPTSPGSGYAYNALPNEKSGDVHDWSIWFGKATFKELVSRKQRFISEYGLQSFPELKTWRSVALPDDDTYDSYLADYKQRSMMPWMGKDSKGNVFNGNDMILEYIKMYFKEPTSFESYVYLSQLMQAEGLKYIIEGHRSHKPYCWGTMYWQIDDCWPTMSWSTMDYYFRWKAGHYFVKKAYKPVIVSPIADDGLVQVRVMSDKFQNEKQTLTVKLLDFDGNVLFADEQPITIKANTSEVYWTRTITGLGAKLDPKKVVLYTTLSKSGDIIDQNTCYLVNFKELELQKPTINVQATKVNDGYELELSSTSFAKAVYLNHPQAEGFFSDNYFDLVPGTVYKVHYTAPQGEKLELPEGLKVTSLIDYQ